VLGLRLLGEVTAPTRVPAPPRRRFRRLRHLRWIPRLARTVATTLAALMALGVLYQGGATYVDEKLHPPPGELLSVGTHRMHLDCWGGGRPTIVLDHSTGGSSVDWSLIAPELALHTRVCTYDRAGFGWSEEGPGTRSAGQQADELARLLAAGYEHGPYVLAGHTQGARVARLFTAEHRRDVAGLVLIDPGKLTDDLRYPEWYRRQQADIRHGVEVNRALAPFGLVRIADPLIAQPKLFDLPESTHAILRGFRASSGHWRALDDQTRARRATIAEERPVTFLGQLPMIVLSANAPDGPVRRVATEANEELLGLSTVGRHRVVNESTNMSLLYREAHAAETTAAILQVLEEARRALPPQPEIEGPFMPLSSRQP
jgi:pimeloyl-ACP methyl ester carboxylesterase